MLDDYLKNYFQIDIEHTTKLSTNGYDFLENNLIEIFGERGKYSNNLNRYFHSPEFQHPNICRVAEKIDAIPELTKFDIDMTLARETYFQEIARALIHGYDSNKEHTDDELMKFAGILGICPGGVNWHEALFPRVLDLFVSSEKEGEEIWDKIEKKKNIISVMITTMVNSMREGHLIEYYDRKLWSQGYARNYFRGENAYYRSSKPSMFRSEYQRAEEKEFELFLSSLRMNEFIVWLLQFSVVRNWPHGDLFHGAIAQHYGLPTNALDVTSNLKVALFFACCKWCTDHWEPLNSADFAEQDSRKFIADLGGDSRYGVIFTAPADVANMSKEVHHKVQKDDVFRPTHVTPIGVQPFLRCAYQNGYVIECGDGYDLYQDLSFAKFKFRHTESLCQWIFKEMEEGKLIYPNEGCATLEKVTDELRKTKIFTEMAFQKTIKEYKDTATQSRLQAEFEKRGYSLAEHLLFCSEKEMEHIQKDLIHQMQTNEILSKHPTMTPMLLIK